MTFSPGKSENLFFKAVAPGELAIAQKIGRLTLAVQVSYVFDSRAITSIATGKTYGVDDRFSFPPPRSFTVNARVKF